MTQSQMDLQIARLEKEITEKVQVRLAERKNHTTRRVIDLERVRELAAKIREYEAQYDSDDR